MKKILLIIIVSLMSTSALAEKPTCHENNGSGYCQYTGKVERIYVNSGNRILLYFDTPFDEGEWDKAGYSASVRGAATVIVDERPDFAKLLYSTVLAAQSTNRLITVQMRNVDNGYMKIDRIWLSR